MSRPVVALLHRSGLFSYLRDRWRSDDSADRAALKEHAAKVVRACLRSELQQLQDQHQEQARHAEQVDARVEELSFAVRHLSSVLAFNAEHRELRHEGAFDLDRIRAHVADTVARAPLSLDPAAHLVIDGLLPQDAYAAILDGIPPESCFSQRDSKKQNFKLSQQVLVPEFSARAWRLFEDEIVAGALLPALVRRLEPHIGSAYRDKYGSAGDAIAALPLLPTKGRLMLRRPGYHLDPHFDPRRVIATCLVYFAHRGDNQDFGTQFFRIDQAPAVDRSNTYFPEAHGYRCELVRTVPFKANSAVVFLNHNCAHGAEIPSSAPKETRRYAYQFYIAPDPKAAALISGSADEDD